MGEGERRDAEILRVTARCDQKCVFCNAREDIGEPTSEGLRERITALAAEGLRRLVLSGGEPTLRKDLPALIRHARDAGIAEVELQTNAVSAAREGVAATLAEAGLTSVFVALHAHESALSDALTAAPGTFAKTCRGIRNYLALPDGPSVALNIVVNRRNYRILPDYVRFVDREFSGFASLSFSFVMSGGSAFRNRWVIPRMSDVAPYLREAYALCRERGIRFSNPGCGVPVCFVPGFEDWSDEYRQLRGVDMRTLAELENNEREKRKVAACGDCLHASSCLGLWTGYLEVHGEAEVQPVRERVRPAAPAPSSVPPAVTPADPREPPSNEVLRVTLACNERCPFCNVPFEDDPDFGTPDTAALKAQIDAFAERAAGRNRELSLSGGEPLLRDDLEELVAYARDIGIERVQIQTNATRLTAERARQLKGAGVTSLFVAYHSHLPDVQDRLTGLRDAGAATREGIRAAIRAGIPVSVNPVLSRPNLPDFPDFIDHLAGLGPLEVVCITVVQPHGRAAKQPALLPRYAEAQPVIAEAVRRAEAHGLRTDTHFASLPPCFLDDDTVRRSLEYKEAALLRAQPLDAPVEERVRSVVAGKVQGPPCLDCRWKNHCSGVWRSYVALHGWDDIRAPHRTVPVWGPPAADPPDVTVVRLMARCNSGCRVCYARGERYPEDRAEIEAALAAGRARGNEQVTFTGQEPTLHDALPALVDRARALGYPAIQLVTNGRRLAYGGYARELVGAGLTELLVPLWSADAAVHDDMTRVPGSFVQTVKGLGRLRAIVTAPEHPPFRNVTVTVGCPVTADNVGDLPALVALVARLGVPRLALLPLRGTERQPTPEALADGIRAAEEAAAREGVEILREDE